MHLLRLFLLLLSFPLYAATPTPPPPPAPLQASVGGLLTLPLQHPNQALCGSSTTPSPLRLHLSGFATGLTPVGCDASSDRPSVTFRLSPETAGSNPVADSGWEMILRNPWSTHRAQFVRQFDASLLNAEGAAIQPSQPLQLTLVTPGRLAFGLLLIAGAWALLFHYGRRSSMLRDSNSTASDLARPYSLSRVQMAWWFGLVFTAYVFIWVMIRDWVALTPSTLGLLGISGATSLIATGIDQPGSGKPRTVDGTAGFCRDILTDVNGITLARLQMVIWNLALGGLFLGQVVANLRIPELDSSTLALLGLSASAYVGFKLPEQQTPASGATEGSQPEAPPSLPADDPKAGYSV